MKTTPEIKSVNAVIKKLQVKYEKTPNQKIYGAITVLENVVKDLEDINETV